MWKWRYTVYTSLCDFGSCKLSMALATIWRWASNLVLSPLLHGLQA